MRDLKDLLDPLTEREMPDRWGEIERRRVRPSAETRRGSRLPTYAISLAVVVVIGLVVARLVPLGGAGGPGADGSPPPAWLIDAANHFAYANGDLTPTSAEWVLTDADTIAPAVGLASGDPGVPEYLVVLHGDFTAYGAKVPSGADVPTGSVLSFAVSADTHDVTDWGVGDQQVSVPGLQPFELPDASQTYTGPGGWTVAVPPGWSVQPFELSSRIGTLKGAMLSNGELPPSVSAVHNPPRASGRGLPRNAVALAVSTTVPDWGGERVWKPPLSIDDFTQGSAPAGAPTLDTLKFANDRAWFLATIKTGDHVSVIDESAVASVIASLTFGPSALESTSVDTESPNYIFQDITVRAGYSRGEGDTVDPSKATVSYRYDWSDGVYPGDHQCQVTVLDDNGAEIGRIPVQFASLVPHPGPGKLGVPVTGDPVDALISCDPERLDTPVAYTISNERVTGPTTRSDGETAISYSFDLGWPVQLPDYPGTNACTERLVDASGATVAQQHGTYGSAPSTITGEMVPKDPGALNTAGSLTLSVECHPWTEADLLPEDR